MPDLIKRLQEEEEKRKAASTKSNIEKPSGKTVQLPAKTVQQSVKPPVQQTVQTPTAQQTTQLPVKTATQQIMAQPVQQKWYRGDQPTASEMAARIMTIGQQNKQAGEQLWNAFQGFQNDPTNPLYNPYKKSSSKALQELGKIFNVDLSNGVSEQFIKENAWLMKYYRTGTGGTPLAPSKKSSPLENAAYWYYKVVNDEAGTQQAEKEWAALQEEISYWTRRVDRNYTDDEILAKIDWKKYPSLLSLDEAKKDGVPASLNRGIGYSQDNLRGVIWAARNGSTGDSFLDSVQYARGVGNQYTDYGFPDNPYISTTLDEAARFFNVAGFDKDWLEKNKNLLNGTEDERKYYLQVANAEETTLKAEKEWEDLQNEVAYLAYRADRNYTDEQILSMVEGKYKTLEKLEEDAKTEPTKLTRGTTYSRQNLLSYLQSIRDYQKTDKDYEAVTRDWFDATKDTYNPYRAGSTQPMDEAAQYFNTYNFEKNWCETHRDILNSGDATAIKYYQQVYDAEQFTRECEEEAKKFFNEINKHIEGKTPEQAANLMDRWLNTSTYSNLKKLNNSLKSGKLLATTRAIKFDLNEYKKQAADYYAKQDAARKDNTNLDSTLTTLGQEPVRSESEQNQIDAGNKKLDDASTTIDAKGTEAEKDRIKFAPDVATDGYTAQVLSGIKTGNMTAQAGYDSAIANAKKYANDYYFRAKTMMRPYLETQDLIRKTQEQISALKSLPEITMDDATRAEIQNLENQLTQYEQRRQEIDNFLNYLETPPSATLGVNGNSYDVSAKLNAQGGWDLASSSKRESAEGMQTDDPQEVHDKITDELIKARISLSNDLDNPGIAPDDEFYDNTIVPLIDKLAAIYQVSEDNTYMIADDFRNTWMENYYSGNDKLRSIVDDLEAEMREYGNVEEVDIDGAVNEWMQTLPDFSSFFNNGEALTIADIVGNRQELDRMMEEIPRQIEELRNKPEADTQERLQTIQALESQLAQLGEQLTTQEETYLKGKEISESVQKGFSNSIDIATINGLDYTQDEDTLTLMDYLYENGGKWEPTNYTNVYTYYDAALMQGIAPEAIMKAAQEGKEQYTEAIKTLDFAIEKAKEMGVSFAFGMEENLQRRRDWYQSQVDAADWFMATQAEDFNDVVKSERSKLMQEIAERGLGPYVVSQQATSELREYGAAAENMENFSKEETDTYLYLYATKGKEEAEKYYNYLVDVRNAEDYQKLVEFSGKFTEMFPVTSNVLAILAAPLEIIPSISTIINGLQGNYLKPTDPIFSVTTFRSGVRETSLEGINEATKDNPTANFLAKLGYQLGTSIGDNMMNMVAFGGIGSGIENTILRNIVTAAPMSFEAGASTYQQAMLAGASPEQALAMTGASVFAEWISETIEVGVIMDAFAKKGADAAVQSMKQMVWETVKDMFSEGVGEAASEVIDAYLEKVIKENINGIEADPDRLNELAGDALYAGLLGFLSGGVFDVTGSIFTGNYKSAITMRYLAQQMGTDPTTLANQINQKMNTMRQTSEQASETAEDTTRRLTAIQGIKTEQSAAKKVAILSAALTFGDSDADADAAKAASLRLIKTHGADKVTDLINDMLVYAEKNHIDPSVVGQIAVYASLNNTVTASAWRTAMNSGITPETMNMLQVAEAADSSSLKVNNQVTNFVKQDRIARKFLYDKVVNGALNDVHNAEQAVTDAEKSLTEAENDLNDQKDLLQEKADTAAAALQELQADPGNENTGKAAVAANEALKAQKIAVSQREITMAKRLDALDRAKKNLTYAQETYNNVEQEVMNEVGEEDQQRAEEARLAEEQAQVQAEQEAAEQAAQQENDNSAVMDADAFIAQLEEQFGPLTDEDRQKVYERIKKQYAERQNAEETAEMQNEPEQPNTQQPNRAERRRRDNFVKRVSKKFDVDIVFEDTTRGGTIGRQNGYYDRANNRIVLDENATAGDAIYAVLGHELTHVAEQSGTYNELADALLQLRYGDGVTYQGLQDDIARRNDRTRAAQDVLGRQKLYNDWFSNNNQQERLSVEGAEQEIVASIMGDVLHDNEGMVDRLVAKEPNLAQRILNSIKQFLGQLTGVEGPWKNDLQGIVDKLETALKDVQGAEASLENGSQYSLLPDLQLSDEDIQNNRAAVLSMPSVKSLHGNEFTMDTGTLKADVLDYYQTNYNGRVDVPELGVVTLDNKGLEKSLGHGMTPIKAAAYAAVPEVLQNGKIVAYNKSWKGQQRDTIAIAGQIEIGEGDQKKNYLMGVVVNRPHHSYSQRYYTHDAVDFVIREIGQSNEQAVDAQAKGGGVQNDYPTIQRLLQDILNVNTDSEKNTPQGKYSLPQLDQEYSKAVANNDMETPDIRYSLPSDDILDQMISSYLASGGMLAPAITKSNQQGQRQFGYDRAQRNTTLSDQVKEHLLNNSLYNKDTNKSQIERAINWIQSLSTEDDPDGYYHAVNQVLSPEFNFASADGQARLFSLLSMAAMKGDVTTETSIADAINEQRTTIAQALQAGQIFRTMSPRGRESIIKRIEDKVNQRLLERNKKPIHLSNETLQMARDAKTEEDFDKVRIRAYQELGEQMPSDWRDKLRGIRYFAMLFNPVTHIRNVIGNAGFMPAIWSKNAIGAGFESIFNAQERTKTLQRASKEVRDFARQDALAMRDTLTGESKYFSSNPVDKYRKTFKGWFQKAIQLNSDLLEAEDWVFLKHHYQTALARYMTANNITVEQARQNPSLLTSAREHAINEAQKATYRDASEIANTLSKISQKGGFWGFVVDAAVPFKKTPANILKRGVEYSPLGLIKTLLVDSFKVKNYNDWVKSGQNGNMPTNAMSTAQYFDNIAAGLSGSGVAALGAWLASMGLLKIRLGDEDEIEKQNGRQAYSLNVELFGHDISYTVDWLAPSSMPLFVGASIYNTLSNGIAGDNPVKMASGIADAFLEITEPVFELSMLDGINSLLTSYNRSSGGAITDILASLMSNYVTSFTPSVIGKVAKTIDTTRRETYVEPGLDDTEGLIQRTWQKILAKVPYATMNLKPYVSPLGEEEQSDTVSAILQNFVSPGYFKEVDISDMEQEMQRLYEATQSKSVIPKQPSKYFEVEGERINMNAKQYEALQKTRGGIAKEMLEKLVQSPEYLAFGQLPNGADTQVKMVSDVWDYATQIAKKQIDSRVKLEGWATKIESGADPIDVLTERRENAAKDAYLAEHRKDMFDALAKNDTGSAIIHIEGLEQAGRKTSDIKRSITEKYKPLYLEAYAKDDYQAITGIEALLEDLGLGYGPGDYSRWIIDYEEEQLNGD